MGFKKALVSREVPLQAKRDLLPQADRPINAKIQSGE